MKKMFQISFDLCAFVILRFARLRKALLRNSSRLFLWWDLETAHQQVADRKYLSLCQSNWLIKHLSPLLAFSMVKLCRHWTETYWGSVGDTMRIQKGIPLLMHNGDFFFNILIKYPWHPRWGSFPMFISQISIRHHNQIQRLYTLFTQPLGINKIEEVH